MKDSYDDSRRGTISKALRSEKFVVTAYDSPDVVSKTKRTLSVTEHPGMKKNMPAAGKGTFQEIGSGVNNPSQQSIVVAAVFKPEGEKSWLGLQQTGSGY